MFIRKEGASIMVFQQRLTARIWLLVCLLGLIGCTQPTVEQPEPETPTAAQLPASAMQDVVVHSAFSAQVEVNPVPQGVQGSTGLGYVRAEDRALPIAQRPQNDLFDLADTKTFQPYMIVLNNTDHAKRFLITLLLDYRQVSFTLDGQTGLLHLIDVPPSREVNIPISLTIDTPGQHDLQAIGFEDPFNTTLDLNYRTDIHGYVIARRTSVVVDRAKQPARTLEILDDAAVPATRAQVNLDVMYLRRPTGSSEPIPALERALIYTDTIALGQSYPLQLIVSNVGEENIEVIRAVVPLLNYHQVALDGRNVLAVRLEQSGEELIVNADLPLPNERGVHQFQTVYLDNPYTDLLQPSQASPFVLGSIRAALVVR